MYAVEFIPRLLQLPGYAAKEVGQSEAEDYGYKNKNEFEMRQQISRFFV